MSWTIKADYDDMMPPNQVNEGMIEPRLAVGDEVEFIEPCVITVDTSVEHEDPNSQRVDTEEFEGVDIDVPVGTKAVVVKVYGPNEVDLKFDSGLPYGAIRPQDDKWAEQGDWVGVATIGSDDIHKLKSLGTKVAAKIVVEADNEVAMGVNVEKEHAGTLKWITERVNGQLTDDVLNEAVRKIVSDHLKERPDYYTKLKEVEGADLNPNGVLRGVTQDDYPEGGDYRGPDGYPVASGPQPPKCEVCEEEIVEGEIGWTKEVPDPQYHGGTRTVWTCVRCAEGKDVQAATERGQVLPDELNSSADDLSYEPIRELYQTMLMTMEQLQQAIPTYVMAHQDERGARQARNKIAALAKSINDVTKAAKDVAQESYLLVIDPNNEEGEEPEGELSPS